MDAATAARVVQYDLRPRDTTQLGSNPQTIHVVAAASMRPIPSKIPRGFGLVVREPPRGAGVARCDGDPLEGEDRAFQCRDAA